MSGPHRATRWSIGDGAFELEPFLVMGIVNVTPDSFSDGGSFASADEAVVQGCALAAQGARILDVGGESTRPGASRVDAAEQCRRVLPVIERLRGETDAAISIDTTLAEVAEAALDAGARIVNDVSAGSEDPALLPLVGRRRAGLVLMHRVLPPDEDRYSTSYAAPIITGDVLRAVADALLARVGAALDAGVEPAAIAIDPGLGFGKTPEQNWTLLARIGELADLGYPVLVGASRKSFIGSAIGVEVPKERAFGSAVAAGIAFAGGARVLRVHDVAETVQALRVMEEVMRCGRD